MMNLHQEGQFDAYLPGWARRGGRWLDRFASSVGIPGPMLVVRLVKLGRIAMVMYRWFADAVVVFHAAYVSFVIAGLLAVLAGVLLRWRWVRNPWFRWIHFLFIAVVVVESLFGVECPLTTWEGDLRRAAGEEVAHGTFIGRWAHELLFYDAPDWVFTVAYCAFGALVLAMMILVPPRWPPRANASPGK